MHIYEKWGSYGMQIIFVFKWIFSKFFFVEYFFIFLQPLKVFDEPFIICTSDYHFYLYRKSVINFITSFILQLLLEFLKLN